MADPSPSTDKTSLRTLIALALFPALLYANTLGNSFQYDDLPLIVGNEYVHDLSNIGRFFVSPKLIGDIPLSGYRPITMATFALNYAIGGDNPLGYHALNVAIHIASVLLLFGVALCVMRTLEIPRARDAALAVALLFAAHPINTQPVNYISGRSTLLVGCFSLACFWLYARGIEEDESSRARLCMIGSLAAYLCALLSKEEAVAVPGLLAAYELLRLKMAVDAKAIRRIAVRLLPFVLLTLGFIFYVVRVMRIVGDTAQARTVGENLLTQTKVVFIYLKMIALPIGLSIDHVVPTLSFPFAPVAIVSVLGAAVLAGGSLLLARRAPVVPFGIWWMLIALVPTSTLIALKLVMNEQRLYLAGVGVLLVAGASYGKMLGRVDEEGRRRMRQALACCLVGILAIFSALTIRRNAQWHDPMTLWMSAIDIYPDSMRANAQIANQYLKMNRPEAALPHARKAAEAGPDVVETRIVLAKALAGIGSHAQALQHARAAVDLNPASSDARSCLGTIYARLERWREAEAAWQTALELNPRNEDARVNLERLRAMRAGDSQDP